MTLFKDRRTVGLLNRVSQDVSQLKGDIGLLLGDTKNRALPEGAREVSKIARQQLAAGQAYARSHLPSFRRKMDSGSFSLSILGGALVVGALAYGFYLAKDRLALCNAGHPDDDQATPPEN